MKRFLKKRWLGLPVGIVSAVLVLVLVAGGVLAFNGYDFFQATLSAEVEEAIAVGAFDTWDNLHPYGLDDTEVWVEEGGDAGADHDGIGVLGDVIIALGEDESGNATISITTIPGYEGAGFVAGEWIVIPLNIRNGSSGELTLGAAVTGGGVLVLEASLEKNTGTQTDPIPAGHEGAFLAYDFKAAGPWVDLNSWTEPVPGNSGFSGSAVSDAQVLFVKISVPGNAPPDTYTLTITFNRS